MTNISQYQQQQVIVELLALIERLEVPESAPSFARSGSPIGLSFLDSSLSLNHIVRLSEEVTLNDWRFLSRNLSIDISFDKLSESQVNAGLLYGQYRDTPLEADTGLAVVSDTVGEDRLVTDRGAQTERQLLWLPITTIDRTITSPADLRDSEGRIVPRCSQIESLSLLDAAFYRLLRHLLAVRSNPGDERLHEFRNGIDRQPRWLLQSAISHLVHKGPPVEAFSNGLGTHPELTRQSAWDVVSKDFRGSVFWAPFLQLLYLVSRNYLVIAGLPASKTEHRLHYQAPDLPAQTRRHRWLKVPRRFGDEFTISYQREIPRSLNAYHLTFRAEEGVNVRRAIATTDRDVDSIDLLAEDLAFLSTELGSNPNIVAYEIDRIRLRLQNILDRRLHDVRAADIAVKSQRQTHIGLTKNRQRRETNMRWRFRKAQTAFQERRASRLAVLSHPKLDNGGVPSPDLMQALALDARAYNIGRGVHVSDDARDNYAHVYIRRPADTTSRDQGSFQVALDVALADVRPSLLSQVLWMNGALIVATLMISSAISTEGFRLLLGDDVGGAFNEYVGKVGGNSLDNADGLVALVIVVLGLVFTRLEFPKTRSVLTQLRWRAVGLALASAGTTIYLMVAITTSKSPGDLPAEIFPNAMFGYVLLFAASAMLSLSVRLLSRLARLSLYKSPAWLTWHRVVPRRLMTFTGFRSVVDFLRYETPHVVFDDTKAAQKREMLLGQAYSRQSPSAQRERELDRVNRRLARRSSDLRRRLGTHDVWVVGDGNKLTLSGTVPTLQEKLDCEEDVLTEIGYFVEVENTIAVRPTWSWVIGFGLLGGLSLTVLTAVVVGLAAAAGNATTVALTWLASALYPPGSPILDVFSQSLLQGYVRVLSNLSVGFALTGTFSLLIATFLRSQRLDSGPGAWAMDRGSELASEAAATLTDMDSGHRIVVAYVPSPRQSFEVDIVPPEGLMKHGYKEWGRSSGPCSGFVLAASDPYGSVSESKVPNGAVMSFEPNAAFLYGRARFIEVFVELGATDDEDPAVQASRMSEVIEMVAEETRSIHAAILFMEAPASPPPSDDPMRLRASIGDGVRCRVALPQAALLYRHQFRVNVVERARKLGCRVWIEDRRRVNSRNWLKIGDPITYSWVDRRNAKGREIRSYIPITAVGPARTGATFRFVKFLRKEGFRPSAISMKSMSDNAVIHVWVPSSSAPPNPTTFSRSVDGYPRTYNIIHATKHDCVDLKETDGSVEEEFSDFVRSSLGALCLPSDHVPHGNEGILDGYEVIVGPPMAPRHTGDQEKVALWCIWNIPDMDKAHHTLISELQGAFQFRGLSIDTDYAVSRQPIAHRHVGRIKVALSRSEFFSYLDIEANAEIEPSALLPGVDNFCRELEAEWRSRLQLALDQSVEVQVTWREANLGRWSSVR